MRRCVCLILLLLFSCAEEPDAGDVKKALELRYRWFGEIADLRITSMVPIDGDTYFAQIKFGIRFSRDLEEMERELLERMRRGNLYRDLSLLTVVVSLNEMVQRCGRLNIRRGRTCYLTANVELVNVRGTWSVRFR
jgi:hypothetical protein